MGPGICPDSPRANHAHAAHEATDGRTARQSDARSHAAHTRRLGRRGRDRGREGPLSNPALGSRPIRSAEFACSRRHTPGKPQPRSPDLPRSFPATLLQISPTPREGPRRCRRRAGRRTRSRRARAAKAAAPTSTSRSRARSVPPFLPSLPASPVFLFRLP